ncbi:MAG: amino acid aminotransferase [Phycisphaeraceae bacterium]
MFESIDMAPPDAILGLTEAFCNDLNPDKINLSVGVYQDAHGRTPILACVKEAEKRILHQEQTKAYKPIQGSADYAVVVQALLLGPDHEIIANRRAVTAHTPGGTGALRVAADYLKKMHSKVTVWLSEPTWPNHPGIFQATGLPIKTYPYFDGATNGLAFDAMLAALRRVRAGDVVVLHGGCHNPTGIDPSPDQWERIAEVLAERKAVPLVDFAYQGFATGFRDDAAGLLRLCRPGCELFVCSSFSKNFGLYNERVGALTVIAGSTESAQKVLSQVKACIRANYSNPPAHGAAIVTTVLNDPGLRRQWEDEVKQMRDRINRMRKLFVETLTRKGVKADMSFITRQHGMFSFSGLTQSQVQTLRDEHSIYIVGTGRINVAGMTEANMDRLCQAIAAVVNS